MIKSWLPILRWGPGYSGDRFMGDAVAAIIVTMLLIPQSLAYALLAGLPAHIGLYASIAPLIIYAVLGTSTTLAVGPVAVASLMTAAAAGQVAAPGTAEYLGASIVLAWLGGLMLVVMGLLRLGFLASFLSHPVISGFISASGILIALSQVRHLLGIEAGGSTVPELLPKLLSHLHLSHWPTMLLGFGVMALLILFRRHLRPMLLALGLPTAMADPLARTGPAICVLITVLITWLLNLESAGVNVVGDIPRELPSIALPPLDASLWLELALPAAIIALIGYVETISVAQTLAAKRREQISADQELIALGAANVSSALSGGFPVTGGFSRSVVNFDAGARTPAAGAMTAVGIALATLYLTPAIHHLPIATLAATIIVAVSTLIDFPAIGRTWRYSRPDGAALVATLVITLLAGVETGVGVGVLVSLILFLWRTSRPHIAIVGQVAGTEHFRNVERHHVVCSPKVLSMRVDESLYFPNARYLEDVVADAVASHPGIEHLVIQCSAINAIDSSALESLEAIAHRLDAAGVRLHFSEIKGPVMDRLRDTDLLRHLSGHVFLTHVDALRALDPAVTQAALDSPRAADSARHPAVGNGAAH